MDGILNVLKPPGMTSHDVVSFVRRLLKVKRVGHTGTLDPGVAGVIVICVGKATRLVEYLQNSGKTYRGELTLGITTDTQDAFGQVLEKKENFRLEFFQIEEVLKLFHGRIRQTPPMYSAVRHQGRKLYELARAGEQVERESREVEIKSLKLLGYRDCRGKRLEIGSKVIFEVDCSKGTYIRTLCNDIGEKLGCGAYMSYLIRTKVGRFYLEHTWTLETLSSLCSPEDALQDMVANLIDLPEIIVNYDGQNALLHGRAIGRDDIIKFNNGNLGEGEFTVSNQQGKLIAIVKSSNGFWQPTKVLC